MMPRTICERVRRVLRTFHVALPMDERRCDARLSEEIEAADEHHANAHEAEHFRRQQTGQDDRAHRLQQVRAQAANTHPDSGTKHALGKAALRGAHELKESLDHLRHATMPISILHRRSPLTSRVFPCGHGAKCAVPNPFGERSRRSVNRSGGSLTLRTICDRCG